mmetsp:Transcript_4324/g.7092  ORF Transcript_4324/g.7092 Transcript_4324/m.7092 type:complete len:184 (+) Transcript_4324:228-779(+)
MGTLPPSTANVVGDNYPVGRLQSTFCANLTVMGWVIRLNKPRVLQFLVKRGYDARLPVSSEAAPSSSASAPALHYIAQHGVADMIDTVLADRNCRIEQLDPRGCTPMMVAARFRNFSVAKCLFIYRADCRRGLDGAYAAWLLAFVRKREKNEMNLQTGRYGDDDETYFNISPDPFYITWYSHQ